MSQDNKQQILVIDDETTHRILAKEYLEEAGYSVRLAEDGKRGLKMAMSTRPDLVMIDLMLPSLNGFDLCTTLKNNEATADIPVVLVTASREPDVITRGLEAGIDDFITKPVDWAFLRNRVAHVLSVADARNRASAEKLEMSKKLMAVQDGMGTTSQSHGSPDLAEANAGRLSGDDLQVIDDRMGEMRRSLDAELQASEARHTAQMEAERRLLLAQMETCKAEADKVVAAARNANRAELEEQRLKLEAALRGSQDNARRQREVLVRQHSAQMNALRFEFDKQLRAEREASAENLASEQSAHATKVAQVKQSVELELQALKAEHQKRLQEIEGNVASQLEDSKRDAEGQLQRADQEANERLKACWTVLLTSSLAHSDMTKSIETHLRAMNQGAPRPDDRPVSLTLQDAHKGLKALRASLDRVCILTQMMSGSARLNETTVDLSALVRDTTNKLRALASSNRVSLESTLPEQDVAVLGDQARLTYAVMNLALNAIRHSPPRGKVSIALTGDDQAGVCLQVTDERTGMQPASPIGTMNTADRATPMLPDGEYGLGVPITTATARLHDGEFEFDSRLAHGTTATIRLPASRNRSQSIGNLYTISGAVEKPRSTGVSCQSA